MSFEERKFEQALDSLAEKEKRAQRRATLLTVLTLALGLLLMAGLFYQIVRLRNTRTGLEHDVRDLEAKKAAAAEELNKTKTDLENAKKDIEAASKKFQDIEGKIRAGRTAEALQIASTGIKRDSVSQSTAAPGFINDRSFQGPAQTRITITVIPDSALLASPTRPNTLYTYQVDGDQTHFMTGQTSFAVSLDRSKRVSLVLDFAKQGQAGYTIKQTASNGRNKRTEFHIDPAQTRVGQTVWLNFSVE